MFNAIGLSILALFLFSGCDGGGKSTPTEAAAPGKPAQNSTRPSTVGKGPSVLDVPPEKMRDVLTDAYRLRPDKRFLLAIAEMHHFLSGKEIDAVSAEFTNEEWKIRYRNMDVGILPELPDFSDIMVLLQGWATSLQKSYPLHLTPASSGPLPAQDQIQDQLDRFLAPYAASAALQVDALWNGGSRDPRLLHSAAQALVALSVQELDSLETADKLPAKALAILALAKGPGGMPCEREESLLAYTMGYSGHAESIVKDLPETDAVRLYVMRDDRGLKTVADDKNGTPEARYLLLLRLAELRDPESFLAWTTRHFSDTWLYLPVFKAGGNLGGFSVTPVLSEALPHLVLLDLAREVNVMPELNEIIKNIKDKKYSPEEILAISRTIQTILTAETSNLVERFESGLQILDKKYTGPFLDSKTYQSFYLGYFFSALYGLGLHYMDSLSSIEATNRFAETLGKADTGIAADFQRWYRNLASSKAGKGDPAALIEDLKSLPSFGAPPFMRTIEEQKKYFSYGDPGFCRAVKSLVSRMDTRVENRRNLGEVAYTHLLDLNLREKLYGSVLRIASSRNQNLSVWYAFFTGNREHLKELSHSPFLKLEARTNAVGYLEKLESATRDEIKQEYKLLISESPDGWGVRSHYVKYLQKIEDYAGARSELQDWLERKAITTGLEKIFAQVMIAGTYYKEKRYEEGWKAIQPVVASQQAGAMEYAARLLDALGRTEEAEEMARAVVARYPDEMHVRILSASIHWRHGKYDTAAGILKALPHKIGMEAWRFEIAPEFIAAFEERPEEEALAAFSALLKQSFDPFELRQLTYPIGQKTHYELAFKMASQLRSNGMGNLEFLVGSYSYLKGWKGKDSALAWLKKAVPPQMLNPASMIVFREKEYDLLWDLIENPEKGEHAEFVWLMRAAASAKMGREKDPHHKALSDYCKKNSSGYYQGLARFLAGITTENEVLALATDPKKRCEIPYYIGLRAQGEGRYADASDWYRISMETGLVQNGEYRWAHDTLRNWQNAVKSLARLAAERL